MGCDYFGKMMNLFKKIQKILEGIHYSNELPINFVGENWLLKEKKNVAVFFGFNPWKREVASAFFKDFNSAFVYGKINFSKFFLIINKFINKIPTDQKIIFVVWGSKIPSWASIYAYIKNIPIYYVEDGFLRSIGNGLLHTRPSSFCVDKCGIYFDANKASEIENIINNFDFSSNFDLISRAHNGISLFKSARLTKYYDAEPYGVYKSIEKTKKYSILVIGQVEDDASIIKGKTLINRNVDLVLQAKKDFPQADIYFRPHPDFWAGNRKSYSDIKKIKSICAIVPPESSMYELFSVVDHVYTMTSLAGFEALINGLKVTTFGMPFYAGWGLTDDRVKEARRTRQASLEEVFAAAYFLYPKYLHQNSDEYVEFEETVGCFLVDLLKDRNIFDLQENKLFSETERYADKLSISFKVLNFLNKSGNFAAANNDAVMSIIESNFKLADYPQISHLLAKTSNYDILVDYSNRCIKHLRKNIEVLIFNVTLLENFFYSLSIALANSNGRRIEELPNLNEWLLKIPGNCSRFLKIIENYTICLSSNLQYNVIEDLGEKISAIGIGEQTKFRPHWELEDFIQDSLKIKTSAGAFKSLSRIMLRKPTRSERDFWKRHQLGLFFSKKYLEKQNKKYPDSINLIFNQLLYWVQLEEFSKAKSLFLEIVKNFSKNESAFRNFINLRLQELFAYAQTSLRKGDFDVCKIIIENIDFDLNDVSYVFLKINYLKSLGNDADFINFYESLSKKMKSEEKIQGVYAKYLREVGLFVQSKQIYLDMYQKAKTVARKNSLVQELDKLDFCLESSRILNSVPQPSLPKGVVFLASQTCFNTLAMMIPSLVELKKKGYAVVNLMAGMTEEAPVGIDFIDQFSQVIPLKLSFYDFKNQWEVHWDAKKVCANGINFYQGFYEGLSVQSRRFHVDINAPQISKNFREKLHRADTCLTICQRIYSEVVGRGIPVSFVSGNSHVTPFSVFRDFSRQKNHPLLNFINCNVAYESYFSNLGSKFANTMCVTDMTLYPDIRAPFMARKDLFDRWYEKNKNNSEFIEKSKNLIYVNRVGSTSNKKEVELIEFIKEQKQQGKKIVCAFGKVPVDLNVPYDGGAAHEDMADWINQTVEICGKSEDIVLLVKPHPHELRPEIALDLVESFHDLINVKVEDNVLLLGHKDINGHALAPYLDLAILYNGSSSLELAAQGIPVLMASYFGKHDYPVELNYPESRADYEEFILSKKYPLPSEDVRKKAAFLMCYLGTEEVSIINQYSLRQLTNDKIGVPKWRKEKIDEFILNGDSKMRLIADRIVEKFEKQKH